MLRPDVRRVLGHFDFDLNGEDGALLEPEFHRLLENCRRLSWRTGSVEVTDLPAAGGANRLSNS